ncbi:hypothetical protein RSAG8_13677, partial [Rhizoctonia solani AG-8 WAC10335]
MDHKLDKALQGVGYQGGIVNVAALLPQHVWQQTLCPMPDNSQVE